MGVNYKLCVKLHKGSFAFNMEKFPSLQNFYTHTDVTDNYQVCFSGTFVLGIKFYIRMANFMM